MHHKAHLIVIGAIILGILALLGGSQALRGQLSEPECYFEVCEGCDVPGYFSAADGYGIEEGICVPLSNGDEMACDEYCSEHPIDYVELAEDIAAGQDAPLDDPIMPTELPDLVAVLDETRTAGPIATIGNSPFSMGNCTDTFKIGAIVRNDGTADAGPHTNALALSKGDTIVGGEISQATLPMGTEDVLGATFTTTGQPGDTPFELDYNTVYLLRIGADIAPGQPEGVVAESNEDCTSAGNYGEESPLGNCISTEIYTLDCRPDIAVSQFYVPPNPPNIPNLNLQYCAGEQLNDPISIEITNESSIDTLFDLTITATKDYSESVIAETTLTPISADSSHPVQIANVLLPEEAGTYTFRACASADDDKIAANNCTQTEITLHNCRPELQIHQTHTGIPYTIGSVSELIPHGSYTYCPGEDISISPNVSNTQGWALPGVTVTAKIEDANGNVITEYSTTIDIAEDSDFSYLPSEEIQRWTAVEGSYTISGCVDPPGETGYGIFREESDETENNCHSREITVLASSDPACQIDLVPTLTALPVSNPEMFPCRLKFDFSVENQGALQAYSSWTDTLSLNGETVFTFENAYSGLTLEHGETYENRRPGSHPSNFGGYQNHHFSIDDLLGSPGHDTGSFTFEGCTGISPSHPRMSAEDASNNCATLTFNCGE